MRRLAFLEPENSHGPCVPGRHVNTAFEENTTCQFGDVLSPDTKYISVLEVTAISHSAFGLFLVWIVSVPPPSRTSLATASKEKCPKKNNIYCSCSAAETAEIIRGSLAAGLGWQVVEGGAELFLSWISPASAVGGASN